jgi:hypothetical protein
VPHVTFYRESWQLPRSVTTRFPHFSGLTQQADPAKVVMFVKHIGHTFGGCTAAGAVSEPASTFCDAPAESRRRGLWLIPRWWSRLDVVEDHQ